MTQNAPNFKIQIGYIPSDNLDVVWDAVSPLLDTVIDKDNPDYYLEDIYAAIMAKKAWLVVVTEEGELLAALVCSEKNYPRKKILHVDMCAGKDLYKWRLQVIEFLKQGASNIGASHIEWRGRKGFEKVYSDIAEFKSTIMTIKVK